MNAALAAIVQVVSTFPPSITPDIVVVAPTATMTATVDGGTSLAVVMVGVPVGDGTQLYTGTITSLGGNLTITCNITGDYATDPIASIGGTITVVNNTADTHTFAATFDVSICPAIVGGSLDGGTVKLTLITNGPGTVECAGTTPVVQVTSDGQAFQSFYYCPFSMGISGTGSISAATQYGLPGPGYVGPPMMHSIGERQTFSLTGFDTVTTTLNLLFKAAIPYAPPGCSADLDQNGVVGGSDLAILFAHWGESDFCPASLVGDLDFDGEVGGADLAILLNRWGSCGP